MATLIELKEKLKPYKDTLVIDEFDRISRLVDVEDGEEDFYWVLDNSKEGIYRFSCVGGWIPLKGFIPDKDYNRMVYKWNLNNKEKAI